MLKGQISIYEFLAAPADELLVKDSIGSLERDHKTTVKTLLDELAGREYTDAVTLEKALVRKIRGILEECTADDLSMMMKHIDERLMTNIKISLCNQQDDRNMRYWFDSENNASAVIEGAPHAYYCGSLGSHKKYNAGIERYYYSRMNHAYRIYMIDFARMFAELYMYTECIRYYEGIRSLEAEELNENIVFRLQSEREKKSPDYGRKENGYSSFSLADLACRTYRIGYGFRRDPWDRIYYGPDKMFFDIYTEKRIMRQRRIYIEGLERDYALSFMPLKDKPQKYIDAAEASEFAKVFGETEYDPDTDIAKMDAAAKEFGAVMTLFKKPDLKEYAIRFRKLGNHKASGLYFPTMQCLCVDIRTPGSFVHEMFHLMDYKGGELSLKYDFLAIRKEYEKAVRQNIKTVPAETKKKLEGKSKFNLAYYLEPTEIFARCGEMYVRQILKVSNTLNSLYGGFAYPDDCNDLMELIREYFDKFFAKL